MKRHGSKLVLWVVVLVWLIGGAVGLAAEKEEKPQFVAVVTEDVKPEAMETYLKTRAVMNQLCRQYDWEIPNLTFVQDFRVTTCYVFHAFGQLDGLPQKFEALNKKTGGKAMTLDERRGNCVNENSTALVVRRPDLSYAPKSPAFVPSFDEPYYTFRVIYHIKPGKFTQAEEVAKRIKALSEKSQSPMGYSMYEQIFGPDSCCLTAVMSAKDKAAFVAQDQQGQANPDPEIEKIFTENAHLLKKIETEEGTFVPEASYIKEGSF